MTTMTAEHGSSPQWPVFLCTETHSQGRPSIGIHYHLAGGTSGRTRWNNTVWEESGSHTVAGRRFSPRPEDLTPVQECTCATHPPEPHLHSVQTGFEHYLMYRPIGTCTDYTDVPGLFGKDEHVTTGPAGTVATLHPCTNHASHPDTPHTHTRVGGLWGNPERPTGVPRVMNDDGTQRLFARGEHLTPESEPHPCEILDHPIDRVHTHSDDVAHIWGIPGPPPDFASPRVKNDDGSDRLFHRTTPRHELVTPPERESTMSTFTPGQIVTASAGRPGGVTAFTPLLIAGQAGDHVTVVCGVGREAPGWLFPGSSRADRETDRRLADLHAHGWNILERNLTLTTAPLSADLQVVRDALWPGEAHTPEPVELRPLTVEKMREHPSFTLHSRPGTMDGNEIVFGCQRFRMGVIQNGHGTMEFTPTGVVVTMGARSDGSYVYVGDRRLGLGDINEWTLSITAHPALPIPVTNAIVMEYGFYRCATHLGVHMLYLLDGVDGPRIGRVHSGGGGTIGQRRGFAGPSPIRDCVPVKDSATARIMEIEHESKYALVPYSPERGDFSAFTTGTIPETSGFTPITPCDLRGRVMTVSLADAEPF